MATTKHAFSVTMALADNIRELRNTHGITQSELADAIGVSHPRISEIEKDRANPTLSTISKLARYFGVTEADLLSKKLLEKA